MIIFPSSSSIIRSGTALFLTLLPMQPPPSCLRAGSSIEFSGLFLLFQLLLLDLRGKWECLGLVQDINLAVSGPLVIL